MFDSDSYADLLNLVDDILLQILSLCGIYGVLTVGQTCRRMRALALDKHVWLLLVKDLEARNFLDLPPGRKLHEHTTPELTMLIKRMVKGPESWSPSYPSQPVLDEQRVVHPTIQLSGQVFEEEHEARLLPGGRYVLFKTFHDLECWHVAEDRLVWHRNPEQSLGINNFAFEKVEDCEAVIILMCQRLQSVIGERKNRAEMVHLDLLTGEQHLLMQTRVPDTTFDDAFSFPKVCNEIAGFCLNADESSMIVVLNWKTQSCLLLLTSATRQLFSGISLIPGYLVLLSQNGPSDERCKMSIYTTEYFAPLWFPNDPETEKSSNLAPITEASPLIIETIELESSYGIEIPLLLSAKESPVHENCYHIWTCIRFRNLSGRFSLVHRYRFSSRNSQPELIRRFTLEAQGQGSYRMVREVAFSGHTQVCEYRRNRTQRLLSLSELQENVNLRSKGNGDGDVVKLKGVGDFVHVSAYSGALTYSTRDSIVINYYS